MGKKGGQFYAVARGRQVGIYHTWDDCKNQVNGYPNARYKKFNTANEANAFIRENASQPYASASNYVAPVCEPSSSIPKSFPYSCKSKTAGVFGSGNNSHGHSHRNFSTSSVSKRSLKVTDERIINKRSNMNEHNAVDRSKYSVDDSDFVIAYTDGACSANGRLGSKAGIGVWFGDNHELNVSEPVIGRQTNNTAEIQAAERCILQAKKAGEFLCILSQYPGIRKLNIRTDSQFTINCITNWIHKWKRNNWMLNNKEKVKNKEDLQKLDDATAGMEIKWVSTYVKGHAGHHGNEQADRLAVRGANKI